MPRPSRARLRSRARRRREELTRRLHLHRFPHFRPSTLRVPPGTLVPDPLAEKPIIRVIAFGPDAVEERRVESLEELWDFRGRHPVTWVNIDGLGDLAAIRQIGYTFRLHSLALEDVINARQRPKIERYESQLFIVARMLDLRDEHLETDQLSLFLGPDYVVTFQQRHGDCFDVLRERIRQKQGHVRNLGTDYLAYELIDAVLDSYFPLIERYGERLDALEERVLERASRAHAAELIQIKQDLLTIRRAAFPTRELLNTMLRDDMPPITSQTRFYLRDCYDHVVQVLDLLETDRELGSDLLDLYLSSVSHRMNEVMRGLTVIATIFLPLTFFAGIYGMNFDVLPELHWRYGYLYFWIACAAITGLTMVLLYWFGWIGYRHEQSERAKRDRDERAG